MPRLASAPEVSLGLLPHLRRARDHIDRYYSSPLDLDSLASVAGVSRFHFARSFEAAYGATTFIDVGPDQVLGKLVARNVEGATAVSLEEQRVGNA